LALPKTLKLKESVMADKSDSKRWPPIILYGVIINHAIQSGDKEVMQAVAKVSDFMMERAGDMSSAGGDVAEMAADWKSAHKDLMHALG
jgi:hypothetical protein